MNIGENIKRIRRSKGITQTTLADETKIPYRTLQDYENNKIKEPAISKLFVIANKLEVSLEELTGEMETLKKELKLKDSIASKKNYNK
jgi:transcriptional regulator with XRE-family HTH domain